MSGHANRCLKRSLLGTEFQFVRALHQKMLLENVRLALDAKIKTLKHDS